MSALASIIRIDLLELEEYLLGVNFCINESVLAHVLSGMMWNQIETRISI